ncbi:hypothetical protein HDU92_007749 [Lobulomyces angularis]|nr:hypothetical protein HDU92_007749 [Lobulomyces angularis]
MYKFINEGLNNKILCKDIHIAHLNSLRVSILESSNTYCFYNIGIINYQLKELEEEILCDILRNIPVSKKCISYLLKKANNSNLSSSDLELFYPMNIKIDEFDDIFNYVISFDIVICYFYEEDNIHVIFNDQSKILNINFLIHNIKEKVKIHIDRNKDVYSNKNVAVIISKNEINNKITSYCNNSNDINEKDKIIMPDIMLLPNINDYINIKKDTNKEVIKMVISSDLGDYKENKNYNNVNSCSVSRNESYDDITLQYDVNFKEDTNFDILLNAIDNNINMLNKFKANIESLKTNSKHIK